MKGWRVPTVTMMMRSFILFAASLLLAHLLPAQPARSQHVEAELVAETASLAPGETGWLALRLKMDPHWHTYWVNPGEFGQVTRIEWDQLPDGVELGDFHWPAPKLYQQSGIINYVFEGEVFLLFSIKLSEDFAGSELKLAGEGKWLECDENECVPGKAPLALTLPVKPGKPEPSRWAEDFAKTRQAWPKPLPENWSVKAYSKGDEAFLLRLKPLDDANTKATGIYFFAEQEVTAPAEAQRWSPDGDGGYLLYVARSEYAEGEIARLPGVIKADNGWLADGGISFMAIDPALQAVTVTPGLSDAAGTGGAPTSLAGLILFAFIGGLILNLMPCVFPVLGLKIMSFVNQGGESRGRVIAHGLVYTLGVLISFWVLAAVLLALRAGGEQLGWGFQLQSLGFVLAMTVVLLVFGLNMSGVFEVGMSAVGVGSNLTGKSGMSGSFFSGVLATLVATPCAAPFLAPALGAALALPAAQSVLLFSVIGLGLSFPYLLFSIFPALANKLPRPGAWMDTFKKALAFLLYGTVAYLVWILAGLAEAEQFLNILMALVGIALACWLYGSYGTIGSKRRGLGIGAAALVLAGSLFLGFYSPKSEITWQAWSPELVEKLRDEGRTVYVDFTARWCATCQVNKRVVFNSDAVIAAMKRENVALLKADWTNEDPAITEALRSFGRSAVPFNVIYSPQLDKPLELPELLTPDIVLNALKKAEGQ